MERGREGERESPGERERERERERELLSERDSNLQCVRLVMLLSLSLSLHVFIVAARPTIHRIVNYSCEVAMCDVYDLWSYKISSH